MKNIKKTKLCEAITISTISHIFKPSLLLQKKISLINSKIMFNYKQGNDKTMQSADMLFI